ncbi:CENP-H domain containing protein [Pyrenophora tritici-repentis]|uniref:Centromere protein H C-terminal domain-containing protein n=1 Tax=Pyrenophora tritici-repentis (strain Pt-1C-BFP) TaxID=426418 RepID=B2WEL0_PYRTR|nr:uncharacterized protein PTRG_08583 [Pyrenophora tritici-repentis Pt-1C-BFP]KAA8615469.1 CENP-H domain-containing protein [Pyrenophora tritici-repentis]EDU51502.1 conserved hypothetical protein [Pyrenophora tritici-repentis Pt-1C-BFP]KAI0578629.1 CENP-H domain-containing protein [Pyrenophora tritici-repentis]KAI0607923.1 CENP-H domain-containing protein [Pyrenophora tritici-repentis]KAI0624366.1 CENP-H domain-containing protein [Pyrenophora tritici-repentis]
MANKDVDMVDAAVRAPDSNGYAQLLQTNHSDAFAFSETEELALQLYDQLRELELQQSLIQAQQAGMSHPAASLQHEAMEAKAEYDIRNKITDNVLVMDPVLKAVHGGEQTPFGEKRILPLIAENDTVSMVHGLETSKLAAVTRTLSVAEQGNIAAKQKNRELAQTMLALAEEMKKQSAQDIQDAQLRQRVDAVEKEVKESRRRVSTLKGILSAMVVGSGINWAADEALTELVMDDEE